MPHTEVQQAVVHIFGVHAIARLALGFLNLGVCLPHCGASGVDRSAHAIAHLTFVIKCAPFPQVQVPRNCDPQVRVPRN